MLNLFNRIKSEIRSPTKHLTRQLIEIFYSLIFFKKKEKNNNINPALIWDAGIESITFDFAFLIFESQNLLKKKGYSNFDLIIFCQSGTSIKSPTWENYNLSVNDEDLVLRIENIIVKLAQSFNCINRIIRINDTSILKEEILKRPCIVPLYYHPRYYRPPGPDYHRITKTLLKDRTVIPPSLNLPIKSSEKINKTRNLLTTDTYITITLRDYGFGKNRNTTSEDIFTAQKFAKKLNTTLIIVPDKISNLEKYNIKKDIIISFEARECMFDRIDLYTNSMLNIFPPCGPANVSLFSKSTKTIIFNVGGGGFYNTEKTFKENHNFNPGDQPYLKLNGYLMWVREFPKFNYENLLFAYQLLSK